MTRLFVCLSLCLCPCVMAAQSGPVIIDPGLSSEQVIARLGPPSGQTRSGSKTFLSFDNGCGRGCGGDDMVVLQNDSVVDAVFRTGRRVYGGAGKATTLPTISKRPAPDQIHPASPGDSAHRGGIVSVGPRPPASPSHYVVIKPNHADSAGMASPHPDSTTPHKE